MYTKRKTTNLHELTKKTGKQTYEHGKNTNDVQQNGKKTIQVKMNRL